MAADIEKVLSCFPDYKKEKSNQWKAYCPCHKDTNRSLSIALRDGKILLYDFGGCKTNDILDKVKLEWANLGSENNKPIHTVFDRILYGQKKKYGDSTKLTGIYEYTDENGKYLYHKLRFEGGDFGKEGKNLSDITE